MEYQNIDIQDDDGIILLTINRPKALNALNNRTILEIAHFFEHNAPNRKDLQGVIITGAGQKAFVAGADIKEFMGLNRADDGLEMARRGQDAFFLIERFPKPVIAAVNGYALGGGCELSMACHLRIASENASFGQPEVNLGIIPGYGGTQRLTQYIGKAKALELILTGDSITAQEALNLGLVNYVVDRELLIEKSKKLIKKVALKGPIAVAKAIEAVNAYFQEGVDGFEVEANLFGNTTATLDFREGAKAFIEKRKPVFQGT